MESGPRPYGRYASRKNGENGRQKEGTMKQKNFDWTVVVTCQGQPFYYRQRNLFCGMVALVYQYLKKRKYGTMNFSLKQKFK